MKLRRACLRFLVLSVLSLVVFDLVICSSHLAFAADQASLSISAANDSLQHAFSVVSEAEDAGGNVSGLMVELSDAGSLLASAEMAYRNGDASAAISSADNCTSRAQAIAVEASALKDSATASSQKRFLNILLFSFSGIAGSLVVLALVWSWFKRGYTKKLMKMKPEVAD